MTILRTDKIAGLESVNAITGSVRFDQDGYLYVDAHDDWSLDGDFTIECWVKRDAATSFADKFTIGDAKESTGLELYIGSTGTALKIYSNNGAIIEAAAGSYSAGVWHHLAVVRSGNTIKLYVDGTADNNTATNTATFSGVLRLGAEFYNNPSTPTVRSTFFMSNFRIVKGTALYTANFTVPTRQLENISGTSILCCQSSRDVAQEATGKTIVPTSTNLNSPPPKTSTDVPDVGNDHTHGTVLEGNIEFPSLNYMTLPRGTTTQSNRGRGMFVAAEASNWSNAISYIQIQTLGEVKDFGDLIYPRRHLAGTSSATRGVIGGGVGPSWPSNKTTEYSTLATTGNATSFGELLDEKYGMGCMASSTRGIFSGGYSPSPVSANVNVMEYITFATTGNALDFGDQTDGSSFLVRYTSSGISNGTRGTIAGGYTGSGYVDTIVYVPNIASLSNTSDFGNLSGTRAQMCGCSDKTRGVFMGGYVNPANLNTIEYITLASTGDATDFGDLTSSGASGSAVSNSIRGVTQIGNGNIINYVNIQTTGNAKDFGDLNTVGGSLGANANFSDSHGGL